MVPTAGIASHVRGSDTVARHGGDEFVVVLASADAEVAGRAAANILAATGGRYHLHGHDVELTTSIGISLYPADGTDFESLVERADSAMYRAKAAGGNAYRFFAPDGWEPPSPSGPMKRSESA
jgi:diguanylate cyclase (GGDEF)-like protein